MYTLISLDGQFISSEAPAISPLDRGFTLGDGVFETLKVTDGSAWYLDRHLHRLAHGADRLRITLPLELREWIAAVVQHACTENKRTHALRVIVTRGIAQTPGLMGDTTGRPTVAILATDMPDIAPVIYEHGVSAQVASSRRSIHSATAGLKTTNYLESILMLHEAHEAGYDDAIALDTRGFVAEASASNVFLWIDDVLVTPPCTCGILPGITRAVILELAAQDGIPSAEREVTLDDLAQAKEAFLTSSLRGIVPLVQVGQITIGTGVPGSHTRLLMARYGAMSSRV